MSLRYRGSLISSTAPTIAPSSAQSIWALQEQYQAQASSLWPPSGVGFDEYFENVSLLLPGNGTNGAQNNTFLDSSINNFTITRNGSTTQGTFTPFSKVDGRWGNYFDGSGDYLTIPSDTAFDFGSGDFTVECWAYPTTWDSIAVGIFGKRATTSAANQIGLEFSGSGGTIRFAYNSGGSEIGVTGGSGTLNTWQHIAIVRNGTALTIYKNGVSVGTATINVSISTNSDSLSIGSVSASGQFPMNGYITNLRFVKGTAVYTGAFTPPTAPLTAITNTSLLTCQSNRFRDNSTNAFAITRNGDVSVQTFSPFPTLTAYASGTNGGSGYFDGTGDWLTSATSGGNCVLSGNFTVESWVYPTSWGAYQRVISGGASTFYWTLGFSTTWDGNLKINWFDGSDYFSSAYSPGSPLNTWYHLAVVRTGSTIYYYINGVQYGTSTYSATPGNANGGYMIGNRIGATEPWFGYMTDSRVVLGTNVYGTGSTITIPTAPLTAVSGTSLLLNYTNAGVIDNTMSNVLETVGGAQISTTQSKFGGSSIYFDGTGDYLVARYNKSLGLLDNQADFTLEGWFYKTVAGTTQVLLSTFEFSGTYTGWALQFNSSNFAEFYCYDSGNNPQLLTGTGTIALNTWIHVAVSRHSGNTRLFVDGSIQTTRATAFANTVTESPLIMGMRPGFADQLFTGYMDDVRITSGIARYTANFTAPLVPFNGFGN